MRDFYHTPLILLARSLQQGFDPNQGNVRRPCDDPGAGCGASALGGINPPIIPGIRPTPGGGGVNPPIVPGARPVPGGGASPGEG